MVARRAVSLSLNGDASSLGLNIKRTESGSLAIVEPLISERRRKEIDEKQMKRKDRSIGIFDRLCSIRRQDAVTARIS